MKTLTILLTVLLALTALAAKAAPPAESTTPAKPAPPSVPEPPPKTYAITNTFTLGGEGPWEVSLTVDPDGKLIFIPRDNHTMVIDAATGKVTGDIAAAGGPRRGTGMRSVALVPAANRGFISQTKDGSVLVFDLKTYAVLGKIPVGNEPGNLIYDEASKKIILASEGKKFLVCFSPDIDLKNPKLDPPIDLRERPNSLAADGKGMVYVTLRDKDEIAVVDTRIMKLATTWQVPIPANGISMDRLHGRLFLGCWDRVTVISAADGHVLEAGDIPLGAGGVFGTAFNDGNAFATSYGGIFYVLGQESTGKFVVGQKIELPAGLRSVAVNPKTGTLYLPAVEMHNHKTVPRTFRIIAIDKK